MTYIGFWIGCCAGLMGLAPSGGPYPSLPVVYQTRPAGAQRGTATVITVEGINLQQTSQLLFSEPDVSARIIEVRDSPGTKPPATPHQSVRIELKVGAAAEIGIHGFRLVTPFGTSNWVPFALGPFSEMTSDHGNDSLGKAAPLRLPVTVNGVLLQPGAADYYAFEVGAGDEMVFELEASELGSKLDSVLGLLDPRGESMAGNDNFFASRTDSLLGYKFAKGGKYVVSVSDAAGRGGEDYHYRLTAGRFPYVTEVFPLGITRGTVGRARIRGYNLGGTEEVEVDGRGSRREGEFFALKIGPTALPTCETQ